ncbi:MAG TPA: phosphoribosylformylglycinamidine cyclo-ligase, partial [Pseudomonadales bacterium]|nr:phosphoribosylformylglycinamidine cyclo-ligase [Pseudomonadales bacterium]
LAGFSVGVVEKELIITGEKVSVGDVLIALPSSGPHSNGYSLIRKIIERANADLSAPFGESTLGDTLLEPTRIYVKPVLELIRQLPVHAIAHITGGGLTENIPRVLAKGTNAQINTDSWTWPAAFQWLQQNGNVETAEMYRTFNCGVGMVIVVPAIHSQSALDILHEQGEQPWVIGQITANADNGSHVEYIGAKR